MPKSGQRFDPRVLERSALLRELRELAAPLLARGTWPSLDEYTELCERERRARAPELLPVRFAPMVPRQRRPRTREALDLGTLYDGRIALHGEVPCLTASYHDLFNALVWAAFPRSKRALHQRQFRALERWLPSGASRLPNRRTREQDALTLFDEGGSLAIVVASTSGIDDTPPRGRLAEWAPSRVARVIPFGHAVMEHVCFEPTAVRSAAVEIVVSAADGASGRTLLELIDCVLSRRLLDVREFCAPDFDAVVTFAPPEGWDVRVDNGGARALSG